jgi:hypothetical protein
MIKSNMIPSLPISLRFSRGGGQGARRKPQAASRKPQAASRKPSNVRCLANSSSPETSLIGVDCAYRFGLSSVRYLNFLARMIAGV